jgi:hypothetical protein
MADLFISYAHEDEARIQPLVSAFEQQGWSVFWDHRIPAGQTWRSYIGQNLNGARCVVVAWSRHSVESKWVADEADEGQKRNRLIPIFLDRVDPPIGFRGVQAADLTDWQPDRSSPRFEQLVQDIQSILGSASMPLITAQEASDASIPVLQAESKKRSLWLIVSVLAVSALSVGSLLYLYGRDLFATLGFGKTNTAIFIPTYKDMGRLDVCYTFGKKCGQEVANMYCRIQGYETAATFETEHATPTRIIGTGETCNGDFCVAFTQIVCSSESESGSRANWPAN